MYCIGTKIEKVDWRFELSAAKRRKCQVFSGTESQGKRKGVSGGKTMDLGGVCAQGFVDMSQWRCLGCSLFERRCSVRKAKVDAFFVTLFHLSVFDWRKDLVVRMFFCIHVFWFVWALVPSRKGSYFFFRMLCWEGIYITFFGCFRSLQVGRDIRAVVDVMGKDVGRQVRAEDALPEVQLPVSGEWAWKCRRDWGATVFQWDRLPVRCRRYPYAFIRVNWWHGTYSFLIISCKWYVWSLKF